MKQLPMPGNTEAEEQVLACILSNPHSIMQVIDTLKPEHFALPAYQDIYEVMVALTRARKAPTPFSVADELARRQMRSDDIKQIHWEMDQMADSFALDSRIGEYVDSIIRASRNRRLASAAEHIIEMAYHQDEQSVETALELIGQIALDGDLRGVSTFADAIDRYLVELDVRISDRREGRIQGIRTGFTDIDRMIRLVPGMLAILAARTSIGKTSWALAVALHVAKQALQDGKEVCFFSLEMPEGELVQRLLSMDASINSALLGDGLLNDEEHQDIKERAKNLRSIGLHISDNAYRLDTIRSQARLLCSRRKIGLIIVDYLQLIDVPPSERGKSPRHEIIAEMSRSLKRLAQDLQVPIMALAQLNREAEHAEIPQLHHIGESDGIARDADLVAFLHVCKEELEKRNQGDDYCVDFLVRKQRNGRIGQERLYFRPRLTRFDDLWTQGMES